MKQFMPNVIKQIFALVVLCFTVVPSAHAQEEPRVPWDIFVTPKTGVMFSNLTELDGKTKAGLTLGVNAEIFLLPNFSFCTELSYAHHGENNYTNPKTEQKNSFSADYLYTDYTVRWYPIKQLNRLSVFGGVSMGTLFAASVNGEKVKHELNSGNVSIPLGIGFEKGKIAVDARIQYGLTKLADSSIARKNLGNAHLLTFGFTIGYRIHAF